MTRPSLSILSLVFLCCCVASVSPVDAQDGGTAELLERISELEKSVSQLDSRIRLLEKNAGKGEPAAPAVTPPTEEQIRNVVVPYLEKADPVPLEFTPTIMGCNKARIDEFRVIEIGKAQTSGSSTSWMVKVHVQGVCTTAFGKTIPFEKNGGLFEIKQDSFGEWKGSPRRS